MSVANALNSRFKQGDWWVWLYREPDGTPSSWERYSVRATDSSELVIEMASRFAEDEPYNSHHRMRLSLLECFNAAQDRSQWTFKQFAFNQQGSWCEAPHTDNVQAFEEKFNVFLMTALPTPATIVETRTREVAALGGRSTLVRTKRHGYTDAWYVREPRKHAGLAAYKAFGDEEQPGGAFTFELIAMGSSEDVDLSGGLSSQADRSPFG